LYQNETVLCGASKYTRKFYLNPDFDSLPKDIKDELKIMCVLFTEDVGGTIELIFTEKGNLRIRTEAEDGDALYDDIGSALLVKKMKNDKEELFMKLEMYFKMFALGMDPEELEDEVRQGRFEDEDDE
jgi:hypothetical protein